MKSDSIETLIKILLKIYNSKNEYLRKEEFKFIDGEKIQNSDEIIFFLSEIELIETEIDPDVYFLTPETYDLIDSGEIEYYIWRYVDYEDTENLEEIPNIDIDHNISENQSGFKNDKLLRIFLVLILGGMFSWIFYNITFDKKKNELSPEILEKLKIINEEGDTIKIKY